MITAVRGAVADMLHQRMLNAPLSRHNSCRTAGNDSGDTVGGSWYSPHDIQCSIVVQGHGTAAAVDG